ncbi:ABC transporter substrate-binding protein [Bacillus hwajinpoensis]|uniref:ABC transporter substrate-binding protein n=1 Tax=Guptibacillus hwajinpoensis TaxID=208199 RepID=A0A845F3T4_9BACL|nr:ABC transporter substrate-binding protein [Pseudalkalibacillus hwajinpoensis]MYL65356.1 ABC transporter substrate-binding protein [Pseudalkalibacillus hwajinpoensis]
MKKTIFSLLFVLLLSIGLAGCGGSNESSGNGGGDSGDGGEEAGGTLIFGRGGDSVSLDPASVTDGESFKVTKNIFDTLLDYGDDNTDVQEALATDWEVSDDGKTYTFTLREGVKFHDGTDFNADAVVYNFERWMNGNEEAFYYYKSMFGGFKGDEGHVIESVTAKDDYTVEFKLKRPQAPFLKNIAMSPFAIASPDALEKQGDKFGENPVGTGPFVFDQWNRNDKIVLNKNEEYWMDGYPKLDSVIFRAIPDNSARLNALMAGEIDLMDGLNPSDVQQVEDNGDLQTFFRPSMNVGYVGLTTNRGPLKDKLVRQALNHAVDKQALIDSFYAGQAEPAKNPMPPVIGGYNDDIEGYEYDLDKAKELLKEAGYEDGFEMELWAMPVPRPYMPDGQKVAEVLQKSFAEIGVDAEIKSYEWATYLEKARNGEADSFLLGWTGDNGDADNFLYVLLDQDNIGSNNYTYYENQELHDLLIEAQSTPDEEERNKLYKEAQEIIHEDAPWIPLVHSKPALGGSSTIKGFSPHPTGSDKLTKVTLQ